MRDRWTDPAPTGRRVRNERWGVGRRWQARWTEDGREHAKTFATKDAAQTWPSEKDLGIVRRAGRTMTLQEMAERWQASQLHHRPSTRETVDLALSSIILPTLGERMVGDLTRADLQQAVNEWTGPVGGLTGADRVELRRLHAEDGRGRRGDRQGAAGHPPACHPAGPRSCR